MFITYQQEIIRMSKEKGLGSPAGGQFNYLTNEFVGSYYKDIPGKTMEDKKQAMIKYIEGLSNLDKRYSDNPPSPTLAQGLKKTHIARAEMYEYLSGTVLPALKGE